MYLYILPRLFLWKLKFSKKKPFIWFLVRKIDKQILSSLSNVNDLKYNLVYQEIVKGSVKSELAS